MKVWSHVSVSTQRLHLHFFWLNYAKYNFFCHSISISCPFLGGDNLTVSNCWVVNYSFPFSCVWCPESGPVISDLYGSENTRHALNSSRSRVCFRGRDSRVKWVYQYRAVNYFWWHCAEGLNWIFACLSRDVFLFFRWGSKERLLKNSDEKIIHSTNIYWRNLLDLLGMGIFECNVSLFL